MKGSAVRPAWLKIVIASAGPKAFYVRWFQQALARLGLAGEVIAMEHRTSSPSFALADRVVAMPAYNSPDYPAAMREWFARERPDLFLSLNDYEMRVLAGGPADELRTLGCHVAVLAEESYRVVQDKLLTAQRLRQIGVATPATYLGTEAQRLAEECPGDRVFVLKHRFGSGSSGLQVRSAADLVESVAEVSRSVLSADGRRVGGRPDHVVIQDWLPGPEYGVDGVFAVDSGAQLLGVLARRKDRMLDGNTYIATTVAAQRFADAVERIGSLLRPIGHLDIDVMDSADGVPFVIDINARMGGGYPFVHGAGADSPAALLRSLVGLAPDPELLEYRTNVTTARMDDFVALPGRL